VHRTIEKAAPDNVDPKSVAAVYDRRSKALD
jgi:hypothetical protein